MFVWFVHIVTRISILFVLAVCPATCVVGTHVPGAACTPYSLGASHFEHPTLCLVPWIPHVLCVLCVLCLGTSTFCESYARKPHIQVPVPGTPNFSTPCVLETLIFCAPNNLGTLASDMSGFAHLCPLPLPLHPCPCRPCVGALCLVVSPPCTDCPLGAALLHPQGAPVL